MIQKVIATNFRFSNFLIMNELTNYNFDVWFTRIDSDLGELWQLEPNLNNCNLSKTVKFGGSAV